MHTLSGQLHVYTYKDDSRLLSPVAHDLRLRVTRFTATLDGAQVRVRVPVDAIEVDGPVKQGDVDLSAFGKLERGQIKRALAKDVLALKRHAEVIFAGTLHRRADGDDRLTGGLTLVGRTVDVVIPVRFRDGRAVGRVEITPSRWGIKPYSALMGTLKVQDRVAVAFDLAVAEDALPAPVDAE